MSSIDCVSSFGSFTARQRVFVIRAPVNLLLFLSAILTALTGAISGGRVADVQVQSSYGAEARSGQAAMAAVAPSRIVRYWLSLADVWTSATTELHSIIVPSMRVATTPIYLDKPRE